jgi:predicted metal-binding membrane protein
MTPEARQRRRIRTPVLVFTAAAWVAVLVLNPLHRASGHQPAGAPMDPPMAGHGAHAMTHVHAPATELAVWPSLAAWLLMLAAMMSPLLISALRHVHARTLPRRRWRSSTLLVVAYAATWTVAGLALLAVGTAVAGRRVVVAAVLVAAVAWQLSPAKQRCLNRHHARPPLATFGRAADLTALRFGASHALWCIGSCWALMLLPLVVGTWHLVAMVLVTGWMWAELFDKPRPASWRVRVPVRAARIVVARSRRLLVVAPPAPAVAGS